MLRTRRSFCTALALGAAGILLHAGAAHAAPPEFELRFDPATRNEPFSGRVYLFFSRQSETPRSGPNWFHPEPILAKDVSGWQPGASLRIAVGDDQTLRFPARDFPDDLEGYRVQAVARFNETQRRVGTGPGNGFSDARTIENDGRAISLDIDQLVTIPPFEETKWGKLLKVRSERLSDFHDRDIHLRATVRLPASYYDQPGRRYPVILTIPGFGGNHRLVGAHRRIDPVQEPVDEQNQQGVEFIRVLLDPNCPWGHHVFADSANNGPVGTALVTEFLPALDQAFRTIPEPSARLLTGHSSGGWSSLWLQITYPDTFGGVWSTAPDSVDFRDFQNVHIYASDANIWFDQQGQRRPLARRNGRVLMTYKRFDRLEQVLGHGGQLQSFEAVFGPRGADGRPVPLWSRRTGAINPKVANAWRKYDINRILSDQWETLAPQLDGKIHVYMGTRDTFYLEGATQNLKETLANLGSDAVVELVEGADHFTLVTPDLKRRIRREMTETFLKTHPNWPATP